MDKKKRMKERDDKKKNLKDQRQKVINSMMKNFKVDNDWFHLTIKLSINILSIEMFEYLL